MKKILILLGLCLSLFSKDIMMYENSFEVLAVNKNIKEISVGDKKIINVSLFNHNSAIKLYGKNIGNTSMIILFEDNSHEIYQIYVNQNLKFLAKSINNLEPNITLNKLGNGTVTIKGVFKNKKVKDKVYAFLLSAGFDTTKIIDLTTTNKIRKMIRTKLYLVEINNQKAEDLGGITGLGFKSEHINVGINNEADNAVTFSGYLLNNLGFFSDEKRGSETTLKATLNFLETKGVAKILDDTVLMTTEDKNATFRVGGEVYIPTGITQNNGGMPTIQLEEREYGLKLTLSTSFMTKENYMNMKVGIEDSEFDTNPEHNVKLGEYTEVPSFVSKNITTEVVAKSGQIIALGGRLHTEKVVNKEKVPFFGDIPVFGEAFKHKKEGAKSNDLLFFLIPEIVDPNDKLNESNFYAKSKKENKELHTKFLNTKIDTIPTQEVKEPVIKTVKIIEPKEEIKELVPVETKKESKSEIKPKEVVQNSTKYKINIGKVFLRSSPVVGDVKAVWIKGHEFISNKTKDNWLKIEQDCYGGECVEVNEDMWISQKYVQKIF